MLIRTLKLPRQHQEILGMIERHLAKLRARHTLSTDEENAIREAVSEVKEIPSDRTIITPRVALNHSRTFGAANDKLPSFMLQATSPTYIVSR
jgi:hypothetical protein